MIRVAPLAVVATLALAGCPRRSVPTDQPDRGAGPAQELAWSATSGELELVGTLTLPERGTAAPVVVLVHGSGPNSRDHAVSGQLNMGFGFELPMFEQLAADLQSRGIATLRYDKRTCGPFNGCGDNDYPTPAADLTIDVFVEDAASMAASVRLHPGIDPERVWIVGHSQGGQLVPAVVREAGADGGVLLSAPHGPIDELLAHQLGQTEEILRATGASDATIAQATAGLRDMVDKADALRQGTHDGSAFGGASAAFWQSWMDAGDAAPGIADELAVPLVAVSGDYDWNVPPSELGAWEQAFQGDAGLRDTTLLPCVTHALNCVSEPDWQQITADDIGREVVPEVGEVIRGAIGE